MTRYDGNVPTSGTEGKRQAEGSGVMGYMAFGLLEEDGFIPCRPIQLNK